MQVAIVVPTFNNEEYTIRCFESIAKNTDDYLIIWVDDASEEESRERVMAYLDDNSILYKFIVNEENSGFAKSVNKGLRYAIEVGSDYCVIQNNDTEVYDGWLVQMINVIESDEKIGMVGPITTPCESWQSIENLATDYDEFSNLPIYKNNPEEYAKIIHAQYRDKSMIVKKRLAFFSVLLKTKIIEEIGILSEEYGVGFVEDDDYNLRLKKAGYSVALAMGVLLFHNHNTTFSSKYSQEEIAQMRQKNRDILYKKFQKGKYRPNAIDEIWDIEELGLLAKQQKKQLKDQSLQIQEKNSQIQERNKQIAENRKRNDEFIASKSYRLGNLFFRSIKKPYKLVTYPYNFIKILLEK